MAAALCFMSILKGTTRMPCDQGMRSEKGAKFQFISATIGGAFLAIQDQISQAVGGGVSCRVSGCDRDCCLETLEWYLFVQGTI